MPVHPRHRPQHRTVSASTQHLTPTAFNPQYGSIVIQIFVVGSERRIFFAAECISAIQGHPRSLILAPIERANATSY